MLQDQFSAGKPGDEKVAQLRAQVSEVQAIMTQNVERVLERGDRLDELVDRSGDLEASVSWENCEK